MEFTLKFKFKKMNALAGALLITASTILSGCSSRKIVKVFLPTTDGIETPAPGFLTPANGLKPSSGGGIIDIGTFFTSIENYCQEDDAHIIFRISLDSSVFGLIDPPMMFPAQLLIQDGNEFVRYYDYAFKKYNNASVSGFVTEPQKEIYVKLSTLSSSCQQAFDDANESAFFRYEIESLNAAEPIKTFVEFQFSPDFITPIG